jgi:hypothetical protein
VVAVYERMYVQDAGILSRIGVGERAGR